jgi:membrane protease YdiL (CAAX protease family)
MDRHRSAEIWLALGGPALLLAGALVPASRPALAVAVIVGWAVLGLARRTAALGWAASLPLAVAFTWPFVLGADHPFGPVACTEPLSVIAVRRVVVAVVVLAVVAALARLHGSSTFDLGIRRLRRWEAPLAVAAGLAVAVGGLVIGPAVAEPFFGRLEYDRPLGALVPAVIFAVANGSLEEVAYRGALQGWLGRATTPAIAIVLQAVVFGIAHVGPEVTAFVPVHATLMAVVGLLAGLVVRRTGSLAIPIGVHIGADIALYYGLACRQG